MTMTSDTYGLQLRLRLGNIENRDALDDATIVVECLETIVAAIKTRVLAGPVFAHEEGSPLKRGWSAVVILAESHAAIHTYPDIGELFLDVFSCRDFAVDAVSESLTQYFGHFDVRECSTDTRGIHWARHIDHEMTDWRDKR